MKTRYSKWDGSQDPFAADFNVGELVEAISDDVLSGLGVREAIRRLMRTRGLDDLRRRLIRRRVEMARNLNLEGPLSQIKDELDEIVATEAKSEAADHVFLDMLPSQPAALLQQLRGYKFTSSTAQEQFNRLLEKVRQDVLNAYFKQMAGGMASIDADAVARMKQMLNELNAMIAARERGDAYDFEGFMGSYGDMFPEHPRTLDELLELIARRMAAMSRFMSSLSPEQRRQLQELSDVVMQDMDIAFEMDQLQQELRSLMPQLPWDRGIGGMGDEPGDMSGAVDAIETMSDMEELEESLRGDYAGATIDDIDESKLAAALGQEAVQDLRGLKQIERALEEAGMLNRSGGHVELSPRGIRRLGERALVRVFEQLGNDQQGAHEARSTGAGAEATGATLPWRFGDEGEISVAKSVFNAVVRGTPLRLIPDDFELIETQARTRTATALLIDLSFSMPLRGHWVPAKRMALALHSLIESKYPQDDLYLIGFSDYARLLQPSDLTAEGRIERVYGTNMQHAFLLARRLLSKHRGANRQVIMVTDGEPTAHLVDMPNAPPEADFWWPPTPETIHLTLAEAARLRTAGITLNIFMLEDEPGLTRFMAELARRTGGRIFQAAGEDLERFVIRDFVKRHSA